MTLRVQIPAYTDRWMMGDRYGTLIKITRQWVKQTLPSGRTVSVRDGDEIATVKLDVSGRTVRVILADCEVAS